jgi:hypothetical protein
MVVVSGASRSDRMIKPTFLAASLFTLAALAACGESADTTAPTETAAADTTARDAASTDEVIVPADADAAAVDAAVAAARANNPTSAPAPTPAEPSATPD